MKASCRGVRKGLQEHFDSVDSLQTGSDELSARRAGPNGAAAPIDSAGVAHLGTCRRCSGLFAGYHQFRTALRREAAADLGEMDPPDWTSILQACRRARPSNEALTVVSSRRRTAPSGRMALRPYRRLSGAFLLVVLVGFAALFGYRQYGLIRARSFVRSDTVAFVDSLFSAPFFPTSTQPLVSTDADASWFDVTNPYSLSAANASAETGSRGPPAPPGS